MNQPTEIQRQGVAAYVALFNALDQKLEQLGERVVPEVLFSDPFQTLQGRQALMDYLRHFSAEVERPHFEVQRCAWDGDVCFVRWHFSGRLRLLGEWRFDGVSELHLDPKGRVTRHIDHWDAARHFYRRLPVVGMLIRLIERRLAPPSTGGRP